ncbi:hypothetical protein GI374_16940 [Paracoccus sp. S-4012]|nr:hypothetical protein [Paracoccus sp. S-4012]
MRPSANVCKGPIGAIFIGFNARSDRQRQPGVAADLSLEPGNQAVERRMGAADDIGRCRRVGDYVAIPDPRRLNLEIRND